MQLVTGLWLTSVLLFHSHPCRPKPVAFWWDRDWVLHPARSSGGWGRREVIVPSPTSSAGVETLYWASLPLPNLTEIGWRPPNYLENDRCDPLFSLVIYFFQSGKKLKLVPSVYPSAWWSSKAVPPRAADSSACQVSLLIGKTSRSLENWLISAFWSSTSPWKTICQILFPLAFSNNSTTLEGVGSHNQDLLHVYAMILWSLLSSRKKSST